MSRAPGNPVFCARREDLGCAASHPGDKFAAIRAQEQGWFRSRQEERSYCPEHVPDWVAAWRARGAERKVTRTFARQPAVAACLGCGWARTAGTDDPELAALREGAFQHARGQGHKVTVTTSQVLILEPSPVAPAGRVLP